MNSTGWGASGCLPPCHQSNRICSFCAVWSIAGENILKTASCPAGGFYLGGGAALRCELQAATAAVEQQQEYSSQPSIEEVCVLRLLMCNAIVYSERRRGLHIFFSIEKSDPLIPPKNYRVVEKVGVSTGSKSCSTVCVYRIARSKRLFFNSFRMADLVFDREPSFSPTYPTTQEIALHTVFLAKGVIYY